MPRLPEMTATICVFFGLIASGKSSLAEEFSRRLDAPYANSDRLRKELAGAEAGRGRGAAVDQGIYTPAFTRRTYDALLVRAEQEIVRGAGLVVLDGSYQQCSERQRVRDLATRLGSRVLFVLCRCPEEEMRRRMDERARDPLAVSDGRWEVYLAQRQRFEAPTELAPSQILVLDTTRPVAQLADDLITQLAGAGPITPVITAG